ncbi:hypothetical protein LEMA_P094330.1 [Plenodomus lingam JN3]|uniref:ELYS-like domain-containing protein n=1 Tax=Leptosphaeria maculans (strain JN3 / isolate v23.1.3 / race Av1-4-5-6-7-8) TaxID=985895 RepID=E5A311_LEPMJ|nr:hypothetical protein LEMA_P094330.1 [Plenodomus lingam JN3]CBX98024.1 hypothetical protein LEMA_P094330.1 [Plenodomus lingam JN3]
MLDVEDFDTVFQGLNYSNGLVQEIQEYQHALGGRTFFERLLDLLKITGMSHTRKRIYPPKNAQQLQELHRRIVSAKTTLHNKHCLIFYLLKDLSPLQHSEVELSDAFARDVHLEKRFWTFIEGLWALDRMDFAIAVGHLTHPSIIPTFPDDIMHTLLKGRDRLNSVGVQKRKEDEVLPLAYYNCVKPPLDDEKVRVDFAKYLAGRNVTETYWWIHTRPEYEHKALLEILVEQTLEKGAWSSSPVDDGYSRSDKAVELVSLPLSDGEDEFIEKFLTEGKGRTFRGAEDTVMMRRIATGRLTQAVGENGLRGIRKDGVNWEILRDSMKNGLGPRRDEGFRI